MAFRDFWFKYLSVILFLHYVQGNNCEQLWKMILILEWPYKSQNFGNITVTFLFQIN